MHNFHHPDKAAAKAKPMHRPILAGAANPNVGDATRVHKLGFFDHLANMADAIWFAAHRENRRRDRFIRRHEKHTRFYRTGLNGDRAVARRLRQIARNELSPVYAVLTDSTGNKRLDSVPMVKVQIPFDAVRYAAE